MVFRTGSFGDDRISEAHVQAVDSWPRGCNENELSTVAIHVTWSTPPPPQPESKEALANITAQSS